jgi:hypothetical protein
MKELTKKEIKKLIKMGEEEITRWSEFLYELQERLKEYGKS